MKSLAKQGGSEYTRNGCSFPPFCVEKYEYERKYSCMWKRKSRLWKLAILFCVIGMFVMSSKVQAAADRENTETQKVDVPDTLTIADTSKYKDMDYSFLQEFDYGKDNAEETTLTVDTVKELVASTDKKVKEGAIIRTKGYYTVGDGGAAAYEISAKQETGGVELSNGLYANMLPDTYTDANGVKWAIVNVKQFGAVGDGVNEDNGAINYAVINAGKKVAEDSSIARGIVYIPEGEYKCTNQICVDTKNLNIIGQGEKSVLFTDNDYRDEEGYTEHFFQVTNSEHMFFGMFRIEAREVDLYHYMRQFTLIYCSDVYVYQVDLIIPQESYSAYYYEDKQYSNFCCYCGNYRVTVDDCLMKQMSGTYRGANIGVLDIWCKGEEDITFMNCELYGNARDEQIGFFSQDNEDAHVKRVSFINNTVHSEELKYKNIIGNRTMCFSIGYADSNEVEDIWVAGNHFIMEVDSKFMTFGTVKNCVVENNIIEIISTWGQMGSIFDSSNTDSNEVVVQKNQIYMTGKEENLGKQNVVFGKMTFRENQFFSDAQLAYHLATLDCVVEDNNFICLKSIGNTASDCYEFNKNTLKLYNGMRYLAYYDIADEARGVNYNQNTIYNYKRYAGLMSKSKNGVWSALCAVAGANVSSYNFKKNTYYAPNWYYTGVVSEGDKPVNERVFYINTDSKGSIKSTFNISDNILQGAGDYVSYGDISKLTFIQNNNTVLPYTANREEKVCSSIELTKDGQKVTEFATTEDTVNLNTIVKVAETTDEEGNVLTEKVVSDKEIQWYTSVEGIATVSPKGVVTKKMNGDVKVYAVPTDGSGVFGVCTIHFQKKQATKIVTEKDIIELEPELKYYTDYKVLPEGASQDLEWVSSNEKVATVSADGTITGIGAGEAIVTATTLDGGNVSATIKVKVNALSVKKISLKPYHLEYEYTDIGATEQLEVSEYYPEGATNCSIGKWVSSDEEVATVDQKGKMTVVGQGKAWIYAYSTDGKCRGECAVSVQLPKIEKLSVEKVTDTTLELTWTTHPKAMGYFVYQWNNSTSTWDQVAELDPDQSNDTMTYRVSGLTANTSYKYKVNGFVYWWSSKAKEYINSPDVVVSTKTLSYMPVTSMNSDQSILSVQKGATTTGIIYFKPTTANNGKVDISIKSKDEKVASVTSVTSDSGKKVFTVKGVQYGITDIEVVVKDDWGLSLTIPVGVVTDKALPYGSAQAVEQDGNVKITFQALENEKELLAEGSMTGYMIRRTNGTAIYKDLKYIPADGSSSYSYTDETPLSDTSYNYTICPCYTDGTYYFNGYGNGNMTVNMPIGVFAESVVPEKSLYTVEVGSEQSISAKIGPEDVSRIALAWSSMSENIATVTRNKDVKKAGNKDYAIVKGVCVGATTILMETTDGSNLKSSATVVVTPGKINNLQTASNSEHVQLLWDCSEGVSGYCVYRWSESENQWKLRDTIQTNSYTDTEVEIGVIYQYKVAAYYNFNGVKYEGEQSDKILAVANGSNITTGNVSVTAEVRVRGYNGVYDGAEHEAVTMVGVLDTDVITYSEDGKNWSTSVPKLKNVSDSKVVYIALTRGGKTYYASVIARIEAKTLQGGDVTLQKTSGEWTGKKQIPNLVVKSSMSEEDYLTYNLGGFTNVGKYIVSVTGKGNYQGTLELKYTILLKKGSTYTVAGLKYKVTAQGKVSVVGVTNKKKTAITIKNTVSIGGKKCKITAIGAKAFKNCKKLKTVKIGTNVTSIGASAFVGNEKLTKVTIQSKKIKTIGKNAWKNANKEVVFYIPKSCEKTYKKLLSSKTGFKNTMQVEAN